MKCFGYRIVEQSRCILQRKRRVRVREVFIAEFLVGSVLVIELWKPQTVVESEEKLDPTMGLS